MHPDDIKPYNSQVDFISMCADNVNISADEVSRVLEVSLKKAKEETFRLASDDFQRFQGEKLAWSVLFDHEQYGQAAFPGEFKIRSDVLKPIERIKDEKDNYTRAADLFQAPSEAVSQTPRQSAVTQNNVLATTETVAQIPHLPNQCSSALLNTPSNKKAEDKPIGEGDHESYLKQRLAKLAQVSHRFSITRVSQKYHHKLFFDLELVKPNIYHPQFSVFADQPNASQVVTGPSSRRRLKSLAHEYSIRFRAQPVYNDRSGEKGMFVWAEPEPDVGVTQYALGKRHWYRLEWAHEVLKFWVAAHEKELPRFDTFVREIASHKTIVKKAREALGRHGRLTSNAPGDTALVGVERYTNTRSTPLAPVSGDKVTVPPEGTRQFDHLESQYQHQQREQIQQDAFVISDRLQRDSRLGGDDNKDLGTSESDDYEA